MDRRTLSTVLPVQLDRTPVTYPVFRAVKLPEGRYTMLREPQSCGICPKRTRKGLSITR